MVYWLYVFCVNVIEFCMICIKYNLFINLFIYNVFIFKYVYFLISVLLYRGNKKFYVGCYFYLL